MRTPGVLVGLLLLGCGHSKPAPKTVATTAPSDATPAPAPAPGPSDSAPTPAPPANKSLYERLGGLPAIQAVVGEFVANVAADNRINQRFFNTDIENLK